MAKIVHIVGGSLNSGAGRGALWLHNELVEMGYESSFLGRLDPKEHANLPIESHSAAEVARVGIPALALHHYRQLREGTSLAMFKPTGHGFDVHKARSFREADLIHIHWATGITFSAAFWRQLPHERRPIVWTLRDMWPFTGGCHYTAECTRFKEACGSCPLLPRRPGEDATTKEVRLKQNSLPPHMRFVAISDWLKRQAESSAVLNGRPIDVIHNAVPMENFGVLDKREARAALGLPQDAFIAAAGALHFSVPYKGAHVLRSLVEEVPPNEHFRLILFGGDTELIADLDTPYCHHLGKLTDDAMLNRVYAAANVFLMPSIQEAFGKTTIEAMASGTPTIAFKDTAAEEIIEPGISGWLAGAGDVDDFVQCLRAAMQCPAEDRKQMELSSREQAASRFDAPTMARSYHELYQEELERSLMGKGR